MSSFPPNILVLGAGELGTSVVKHLASLSLTGTKITILLRPSSLSSPSPTKAAELATLLAFSPSGTISFLPFDISASTVTSLAAALQPFDTVISCTGFTAGPGSQLKIARAALEAKVPRFVPWQFGVDYDIIGRGCGLEVFDEQLDIRDLLRAHQAKSGEDGQAKTEWIIVSVGIFMSFLFESFWGVVDFGNGKEEVTVRALGSWDNRVTVTTPDDIGKLTAMIVFAEPKVKNEVVFVGGQTLSYAELAATVEKVTGKRVLKELWGMQKLERDLEMAVEAKNEGAIQLGKYRVVFGRGAGCSWDLEKTWNGKAGLEMQGVSECVRYSFPTTIQNLYSTMKRHE